VAYIPYKEETNRLGPVASSCNPAASEVEVVGRRGVGSSVHRCSMLNGVRAKHLVNMVRRGSSVSPGRLRRSEPAQVGNGAGKSFREMQYWDRACE
ncbi:hypothetical protein TNCT_694421, partial [Trichonephila clavata]